MNNAHYTEANLLESGTELRLLILSSSQSLWKTAETKLSDFSTNLVPADSYEEALKDIISTTPDLLLVEYETVSENLHTRLSLLHKLCPESLFLFVLPAKARIRTLEGYDWIWSYLREETLNEDLSSEISTAIFHILELNQKIKLQSAKKENLSYELEWLVWKESISVTNDLQLGKGIIHNLANSMFQGIGIGSLVGQLDLCEFFMKKDEECTRLPEKLMDVVLSTKDALRERIDQIEFFKRYLDLNVERVPMSSSELRDSVERIGKELLPTFRIKNHTLSISDPFEPSVFHCSSEFLNFSLYEILINAMKFSPEGSEIAVSFNVTEQYSSLLVKNSPSRSTNGICGVPEEYYHKVFEPFFRISNLYDERFYTKELGMGIGLNVVRNLAKQIDCKTYLYEVKGSRNNLPGREVVIELKFKNVSSESASEL
ncbi:sensor histidine kinase [Leptospira fletcheri]|uniref:Sensor histidine kinase n=1 Tax=Leptospira fletcheri TaxID=2484981 RepID=A0A4R9GAF4_9LEPT|nr:ATP-binding protein [Leptospira fletcheri]TGK08736.1 sensor histidine kinase [Leptospira fletcheri]